MLFLALRSAFFGAKALLRCAPLLWKQSSSCAVLCFFRNKALLALCSASLETKLSCAALCFKPKFFF